MIFFAEIKNIAKNAFTIYPIDGHSIHTNCRYFCFYISIWIYMYVCNLAWMTTHIFMTSHKFTFLWSTCILAPNILPTWYSVSLKFFFFVFFLFCENLLHFLFELISNANIGCFSFLFVCKYVFIYAKAKNSKKIAAALRLTKRSW